MADYILATLLLFGGFAVFLLCGFAAGMAPSANVVPLQVRWGAIAGAIIAVVGVVYWIWIIAS